MITIDMISYVKSFFIYYIDIIDIMVHYVFFDFLILFPTVATALFRFFSILEGPKTRRRNRSLA